MGNRVAKLVVWLHDRWKCGTELKGLDTGIAHTAPEDVLDAVDEVDAGRIGNRHCQSGRFLVEFRLAKAHLKLVHVARQIDAEPEGEG